MTILGPNKTILLEQLRHTPNPPMEQLVKLLQSYSDLKIDDMRGIVSDMLLEQLAEASRDPEERNAWNMIQGAPRNTPAEIQSLISAVGGYLARYPLGPKTDEAHNLCTDLNNRLAEAYERQRREEEMAREREAWEKLNRNSYASLQSYLARYPESVHKSEIDDMMWSLTKTAVNYSSLNRYLADWPMGAHAQEANLALTQLQEWDDIKHSGDLVRVAEYRLNNLGSPLSAEINSTFYAMRDEELANMRTNPAEYGVDLINRYIDNGVFKKYELIDEGLITDESWDKLFIDRDTYPNLAVHQISDPDIQAPADSTDVYLFGTPGTGKTCLLMGLTGANGNGYELNMRLAGGPYASALQQYVHAGITPGSTFGSFVTVIHGSVSEATKRNRIIDHKINLIEMSGEEFALRISENKSVSLADMGTGATNLLKNNNRKAFFIIVDSIKDNIKVEYVDYVYDNEGNVIDQRIRKRYISQLDILNKFVGLFSLPENQEIMKKVDSIHFIVTKSDLLGDVTERETKAKELLLERYQGPVTALKNLCRRTKRINYATNYNPHVFTFSLGKFYLGDIFKFDSGETLKIVNAIRSVTAGHAEKSWIDKLKEVLG